jgi:hypothetical protein
MSVNYIKNGCIIPNREYKVIAGSFVYNSVTYSAGDYFVGTTKSFYDDGNYTILTPDMTSNTVPSGKCIGDSIYQHNAGYNFWKAFNRSGTDRWISADSTVSSFPHWIGYKFDNLTICNKVCFMTQSNIFDGRIPSKIKIESSFNGIEWVELYRSNISSMTDNYNLKCFEFNNEIEYYYYRLFIEENYNLKYATVGELYFIYEDYNNSNVKIIETSKIITNNIEYSTPEINVNKQWSIQDVSIEYSPDPYDGKFDTQTKFNTLTIESNNKAYGNILKTTNIKMFSNPLNGYQRRAEGDI